MIDPRHPDYANAPGCEKRPRFDYAPRATVDAPDVSIITPYFNAGAVFHQTARCVLGQSFQNWEWLIVNDASTDRLSLDVLHDYRARDPRIRVIDLPANSGPSAARNAGFRAARGAYALTVDSDDLIEPTLVEKFAWYLASHPWHDFVAGWTVGFDARQYLWTRGFHDRDAFLESNLLNPTVMQRRSSFEEVGGYDESIRAGLEDWDYWLRCAEQGHWGGTIPEYLFWYRTRGDHAQRWQDWDRGERQRAFQDRLRQKYPRVFAHGIPTPAEPPTYPLEQVLDDSPLKNPLRKSGRRLLLIAPWFVMGGADKFNLDLVRMLRERGWEVTLVGTLPSSNHWAPEFARLTPDIFLLGSFLRPVDFPRFLRYLIESRQPDVVMPTNSELGYLLLPYLRSVCPQPAYVDYNHMEEEVGANGGYPRYSLGAQEFLDLQVVASEHLRRWMMARGGDENRIATCYINCDPQIWRPDPQTRQRVRAELGVSNSKPVLLFAGRLCPQKQPRVLAETIRQLAARGVEFECWIAGAGEDRAELDRFVAEQRLAPFARLLGEVPSARVTELMAACDIFFLPSAWEGIALTLYEAMAMEIVVVGANVGGQRELVTPDVGVLIERSSEQGEAAEYTARLEALLKTPQTLREMGRRARERIIAEFPLSRMGDRMVELLERAIRLKQETPRAILPPRFARELATQVMESRRIQTLADDLWRRASTGMWLAADPLRNKSAGNGDVAIRDLPLDVAREHLKAIETSRSWRMMRRLKRLSPYAWLARLRWGPAWDIEDPNEDPRARLERIAHSRAYRLIRLLKKTPGYRAYATRKYGPDYDQSAI